METVWNKKKYQSFIKELEKEMKSKYKLRPEDKIEKFADRLDMITSIIDVFS